MKINKTKVELINDAKGQPAKFVNPNSQFISSALSMSWRLAIAILVPVIGGYKLDQHMNSLPLYTIIGFVVAMVGATLIIRQVLNEFSESIDKTGKKQ